VLFVSAVGRLLIEMAVHQNSEDSASLLLGSGAIIRLTSLIFLFIQFVKRMHDINLSGWYSLIPLVNLGLALTDGTPGPNDYGNDPKQRVKSETDKMSA
jgi:uncharacterized membrane protein YhaH (DUF805 family)